MAKRTYRCTICKGTDVKVDASAIWNEQTQAWELVAMYDNAVCETCGDDTHLEEIKLPSSCED